MRGVEALRVVAVPRDVEEVALAIGEGVDHRGGGGNDLLHRAGHAIRSVDRRDMIVIIVDHAERAIDPDAMRDAVDIVDDVDELVAKALERLRAAARRMEQAARIDVAQARHRRAFGQRERQSVAVAGRVGGACLIGHDRLNI